MQGIAVLLLLGCVLCLSMVDGDDFTEMPPECPPRRHLAPCDGSCQLTCDNDKSPPQSCSTDCNPRCVCDEGYILLSEGSSDCVTKDQCPIIEECPHHMHYKDCASCPLTCDNYQSPPQNCTMDCIPRCVCDDGYILLLEGSSDCVEKYQCPVTEECPLRMHLDPCASSCPLTCDNYQSPPQNCSTDCKEGCACDTGYILLSDGSSDCVKMDQCPVIKGCPPHMHFAQCYTSCPLTCDNYQSPPVDCTSDCNPRCVCDTEYVLLSEGSSFCVAKDQCPVKKECPPRMHLAPCNGSCQLTCDNYQSPPVDCTLDCNPRCVCDTEYVLLSEGSSFCVAKDQCPVKIECPPLMHLAPCDGSCQLTCDNYKSPPQSCSTDCNPRCVCDEGYILLSEGSSDCVTKDQCPIIEECPPRMHLAPCNGSCQLTCDNYQSPPVDCTLDCNPRCVCDTEYVLLSEGSSFCVAKDQCPVKIECPPLMHLAPCDGSCQLTCDNYKSPPQSCSTDCNPRCVCDEGYILLSEGSSDCVTKDQCPIIEECPPRMHLAPCNGSCQLTCDNYQSPPQSCSTDCNPRCVCDEGYILLSEGSSDCVTKDQCPIIEGCPPLMHFAQCYTSCPLTCDNYQSPPVDCTLDCNPRCVCDTEYVLLSEGSSTCVAKDQCPVKKDFVTCNGIYKISGTAVPSKVTLQECPPHMHFKSCASSCPLTCDNYQSPPLICTLGCKPGCVCDAGYILLLTGSSSCVEKNQCPISKDAPKSAITERNLKWTTRDTKKECPPHMHFVTCATSCPLTCDNLKSPPKICPKDCKPRCVCDKGYVLVSEGSSKCVRKDQCPIRKECPPHMHFVKCATSCPLTCDNYKSPPKNCTWVCKRRCVCDNGYVMVSEGSSKCVRKDQCPIRKVDAPKSAITEKNLKWTVRDTKKECPPHMHFVTCATSCPLTCDNLKSPPKICPKDCKPRCVCDKGYVLVSEGSSKCVRKDQCPIRKECPPHMHFVKCATSCPLTCDNYKSPPKNCTWVCKRRCVCDKGYVLVSEGSSKCVRKDQCPIRKVGAPKSAITEKNLKWTVRDTKKECPRHMHFVKCATSCPLTCDNYKYPPKKCPTPCKRRCVCDKGYVLVSEGSSKCVKKDKCPIRKECPRHMHFVKCATTCPLTCDNYKYPPKICPKDCKRGCVCDKGYVLISEGSFKCVRKDQCPIRKECPRHMHFVKCATSCPLTCDNYKSPPKNCTKDCKRRCVCDKGYVLLSEGSSKCVRKDQCPIRKGCPKNMTYNTCGSFCPLTCDNYQNPPVCTRDCKAGCFCNDGLVLLKKNSHRCVEKDQCPVCKGCTKNKTTTKGKNEQNPKIVT
ncbi:zonadhesin-like [Ascaphus truei]|uniref:zonadhesin-like n=1 Tax=Ascaphus truei TaxID=8439 RepID=UPI003F5948C6